MGMLMPMLVNVGIQAAGFAASWYLRTERYYDLAGAASNVAIALTSYRGLRAPHGRQTFLTIASTLWATRLGLYLFVRIMRSGGRDSRFDDVRNNLPKFAMYWGIQAVWCYLTNLAVTISNSTPPEQHPSMGAIDAVGILMWIAGLGIEIIADQQKSAFRSNPANKHKFISHGLWSRSRHPNYFGEILLWWGVYVVALPSLSGWSHLALLSPCFVTYMLTRVSGIPLLEYQARKQFGNDPAYRAYVARTPVLIPRIW